MTEKKINEKENSKKIPIKLNTALGFAYLHSVNHHLLFIKSRILSKELQKLEKKKTKSGLEKLVNRQEQELIRIEIMATTVHYAEIFASLLLGMKKYRQFHKFLLEYKVSEIIDFYKNLPKRKPQYVAKILQYPYPNKYVDQRLHGDLKKTISDVTIELKKLAKFYLTFRSFYNSYKHGFRIMTFSPGEEPPGDPDEIFTAYFEDPRKLNTMRSVNTRKNVTTALDLCEFIFKFLDNAQNIFEQRVMRKEKQFTINVLHKQPQ